MTRGSGLAQIGSLFSHRNYALYAAGNLVSMTGSWAQRVAAGWLAWELTGSTFWVGFVAFAELIPGLALAPVGGMIADRVNLLRFTTAMQVLGLLQALLLLFLSLSGNLTIEALAVSSLLLGVISALDQPARLSIIASLIPSTAVPAAVALNATLFNVARFIGPMLAGFAIAASSIDALFVGNALSYAVFVAALLRVKLIAVSAPAAAGTSLWSDLTSGLVFILSRRDISMLMVLLISTSVLLRPLLELLPPFAERVAAAWPGVDGALALAALTSAVGFGAVAGGLFLATRRGDTQSMIKLTMISHLASAAGVLAFVLVDAVPVGLASLAVIGAGLLIAGAGTQTVIQAETGRHLLGRVLALYGMVFRGSPAIGALLIGAVAASVGLELPFLLGVAVSLVIVLAVWRVLAQP